MTEYEYGAEWPEFLNIRMVVLDFDKTITSRHTRGAIFQTAGLEEEELRKNFADLAFFKQIVPIITCKPDSLHKNLQLTLGSPSNPGHRHVC